MFGPCGSGKKTLLHMLLEGRKRVLVVNLSTHEEFTNLKALGITFLKDGIDPEALLMKVLVSLCVTGLGNEGPISVLKV